MYKWKKTIKYGAALLASTAILAACGDDLPAGDEPEGDPTDETAGDEAPDSDIEFDEDDDSVLHVGLTNAPDSFNPFNRSGVSGSWAQRFYLDSIVNQPDAGEFTPRLGEVTTDDEQVFTVEIHPDANWSDGEPITANDVAFTYNSIAHPDVVSSLNQSVAMIEGTDSSGALEEGAEELSGVEVIDEKTVQITTKSPVDPNYINEFLFFRVLIAPEHAYEGVEPAEFAEATASTQPEIFSGPFKYVEYQEENYLHLTKNEDYYLGEPAVDEVYLRVMNGTALLSELQAGNLHMAAGGGIGMVSHQDVDQLEDVEGLVVEENPSVNGQYMIFNTENEPFDDATVRQAFGIALDRQATVDQLIAGRAEVLSSTYSSASPYYIDDLDPLPYDPELAEEMLQEAGFDFDQEIRFLVPEGNEIRRNNGDLIEQWLTEIGVNVSMENYDFTTHLSMAEDGDYDVALMGWGHTVDPNIQSYVYTGAGSNNTRHSDPVVDDLIDQGNAGTSFEERYPIYEELAIHLQEESYYIPLYSDSQFGVRVDYLDGGINEYWEGSLHDLHEWELNP